MCEYIFLRGRNGNKVNGRTEGMMTLGIGVHTADEYPQE